MKTYNRLIAKFMGMEEERHLDGRYLFTTDLEELKGPDTRFTEELYFHISWDWLMPVVDEAYEKIKGNMFPYYKLVMAIEEGLRERNREDVYQAVVKFIIEYNKNK